MSRAASLPGAELFSQTSDFLKKPLVPGSFAAGGRTFSQKRTFRTSGTLVRRANRWKYQKNALSGILGLLCAQQDVGSLEKCTFRNSGTPVRRTRRRKSQKMHFQEFWDSCAQNKTSEVSRNALSGILGLLCAEQDVGNLKKCIFRNSGTEKTSDISKNCIGHELAMVGPID